VKIVFVAGFFDPVRKALEETFPDHLKSGGGLIWIRQVGSGRELNINEFKSRFFDALARGATQILIVMAVLRGKEWIEKTIGTIVSSAKETYPAVEIELRCEKNAQSSSTVLQGIAAFGLPAPPDVSMERLSEKLQGKKILCVVLEGRSGFEQSLDRAGFPTEAFALYFEELSITAGKNSNLIELLSEKSKSFDHLLYAWSGLRTLPPKTKRDFCGLRFEAGSSFEVVLLLKKWVLGN
jgi:hypothetical protein